jgi:signal transduction histidine kinase
MDATADKIQAMRDHQLTRGVRTAAILGFFTLLCSLARIGYGGWHNIMYLHIALYLIVLGVAILERHLSLSIRAAIMAAIPLILGVGALIDGRLAAFGLLALFCCCILSTMFFGGRAGLISCIVSIGIIGTIGACVYAGILRFSNNSVLYVNSPALWLTGMFATALSAGPIVVVLGTFNRQVKELVDALEKQNAELLGINRILENYIAERNRMEEERRKLEGMLQLAKKMESIGKLAGGVAHDLNNTLGSIVGYPDLMLKDLPWDSPLRSPLETIKKTGIKAAAIVNDMLTLARSGIVSTEVFDLNSVISEYFSSPEYERLLSFHQRAQIVLHREKESLNVRGSFFHISKVVMNLVSNAAEAMPEGGRIIISTEKRNVRGPIGVGERIKKGEYAVLSVADTGIGIPHEDLEKIFEPFYTKKSMGRSGTGLGMAVVWGSVKEHNGHITVESVEGQGTKFTVYIPLTNEPVTPKKPSPAPPAQLGRGESILVVDDVKEQREIASRILSKMGYSVYTVGSGEEAIAYLQRASADLLILDMLMAPGMDGLETYKKALELHPGQKALLTTGLSETPRLRAALMLGAGGYLKKPYLFDQIGCAVRVELDLLSRNV